MLQCKVIGTLRIRVQSYLKSQEGYTVGRAFNIIKGKSHVVSLPDSTRRRTLTNGLHICKASLQDSDTQSIPQSTYLCKSNSIQVTSKDAARAIGIVGV